MTMIPQRGIESLPNKNMISRMIPLSAVNRPEMKILTFLTVRFLNKTKSQICTLHLSLYEYMNFQSFPGAFLYVHQLFDHQQ